MLKSAARVLEGGCFCACKSLAFVRTSEGLEGGCFCACRSLAFVMTNKGEGRQGMSKSAAQVLGSGCFVPVEFWLVS